MRNEHLIRIVSLGTFLLFWGVLSLVMADPQVLPSPIVVAQKMAELWASGDIQLHLIDTSIRIAWAFSLAMTLGGLLGYMMGRYPLLNAWLDPWLIVFLNLPALVLIVLCYLWIGLNETAAILAVTLNKLPLVMTLIREGARNASSELRDLAQVFKLSPMHKFRHIILPELLPHLVASSRAGLSVIWKIVLVVEFLGRSTGIGRQIHTQFSIFNVTGVLAYALSFVVFILFIEFFIMQPLERHATRWRQNA
uniref:Taurine transport system permease protein TauC n=1 Tax=uncultured Thiotrichaceae bacterium TaxID=298394 RepID=A0A6S6U9H9_9GAMM|nr:MAG: Taurine transport system permease protein TauC [uncultured Thiotrichaceae bacterium]